MAAKKQYSAQEASEFISTWMHKSNDDENSDTSESFSESESENESDLEDTSINFINETAISKYSIFKVLFLYYFLFFLLGYHGTVENYISFHLMYNT